MMEDIIIFHKEYIYKEICFKHYVPGGKQNRESAEGYSRKTVEKKTRQGSGKMVSTIGA